MTTDIVTKPATDAYREGYDRIFGRCRRATAQAIDPPHGEPGQDAATFPPLDDETTKNTG